MTRVKGKVKFGIGFDFTFDTRQRCRQIYNLFAYSFDMGKTDEVIYVNMLVSLISPLTHVKDEVISVVAVTTLLMLVTDEVKYEHYTLPHF